MSDRPTPETDARLVVISERRSDWTTCEQWAHAGQLMTDHARKMERERDEARMKILAQMARETLTCGWCGDMMHAPPGFTPPMTTEKLKLTVKLHMLDCPKHPIRETEKEVEELRSAIRETIMENLHLADADDCTLKRLKDAIAFDLDSPKH